MMNRVSHFEIQVDEPERAVKFYTDVFGWEIQKWEGGQMEYWMIMTGKREEAGGINGGLMRRPCPGTAVNQGANAFVCTMTVENYDAMHDKILANGGKVAMPKFALKGMAWQGYYLDTENNIIGIHQSDVSAA